MTTTTRQPPKPAPVPLEVVIRVSKTLSYKRCPRPEKPKAREGRES